MFIPVIKTVFSASLLQSSVSHDPSQTTDDDLLSIFINLNMINLIYPLSPHALQHYTVHLDLLFSCTHLIPIAFYYLLFSITVCYVLCCSLR